MIPRCLQHQTKEGEADETCKVNGGLDVPVLVERVLGGALLYRLASEISGAEYDAGGDTFSD
eukprot:CAMPEP_0172485132 /NCGR_PEP_ID=MMETSP1066-20121228/12968_1 /TAXON_ID=671091 /ORGANISM="Coscinodiscus wailesii, Strain CCMP2513" /LENGTH=61 /DNA_ID=CAMNT_0013250121 /DNA_START=492 /DNA_END=677 /DNA_ORIENTATION=+